MNYSQNVYYQKGLYAYGSGNKYFVNLLSERALPVTVNNAIEQSLICIYTIDALANARYEIAEKNYSKFEMEFHLDIKNLNA